MDWQFYLCCFVVGACGGLVRSLYAIYRGEFRSRHCSRFVCNLLGGAISAPFLTALVQYVISSDPMLLIATPFIVGCCWLEIPSVARRIIISPLPGLLRRIADTIEE